MYACMDVKSFLRKKVQILWQYIERKQFEGNIVQILPHLGGKTEVLVENFATIVKTMFTDFAARTR